MLGLLITLVVIQSITLIAAISANGHLLRIRETLQYDQQRKPWSKQ